MSVCAFIYLYWYQSARVMLASWNEFSGRSRVELILFFPVKPSGLGVFFFLEGFYLTQFLNWYRAIQRIWFFFFFWAISFSSLSFKEGICPFYLSCWVYHYKIVYTSTVLVHVDSTVMFSLTPDICNLCLFLVSLARSLSILLLFFWRNQLFVSVIFSIVFLVFFISLISALTFLTAFFPCLLWVSFVLLLVY